jgi:hypothetical protein
MAHLIWSSARLAMTGLRVLNEAHRLGQSPHSVPSSLAQGRMLPRVALGGMCRTNVADHRQKIATYDRFIVMMVNV